ncbi:non-specific serine/threonine protein kinase [Ranunculus cassubicifolius]
MQRGSLQSFIAECEVLREVRHRNLLKILTVCSSIDFNGNDFRALIFEFMSNGSLESWLHPTSNEQHSSRSLDILQRLNIAIDVASALDYLHNHCETPVVHCDLKPSNVLLNENMVACVGDFGLAKFLYNNGTYTSSSIAMRGTIGYIPPGI